MKEEEKGQTRRQFLGSSAALAALSMVPLGFSCKGEQAASTATAVKDAGLNSKFGGVQIGTITYSWRDQPGGLENIVKYCQQSGISSIELMSGDLETFLGAPENPRMAMMRQMQAQNPPQQPAQGGGQPPQGGGAPQGGGGQAPPPRQRMQMTPEQQAIMDKYNEDVVNWRKSISMDKVAEARKLLNDAGIGAHIVKFSPARWSDDEIDYAFKVAKAMGAKAVTEEVSLEAAQKLAPFAEKHDMYVAFHNHAQFADEDFSIDPILAVSPAVMLNFDAGHFYGSTGIHPNEMLKKYHDRIYSLHIKDKTGPTAEEPNRNQVWGQGEMPLEDVLLLIKQEKWPIYCDIELEYTVKPWSNSIKEVGTCVKYARQILI